MGGRGQCRINNGLGEENSFARLVEGQTVGKQSFFQLVPPHFDTDLGQDLLGFRNDTDNQFLIYRLDRWAHTLPLFNKATEPFHCRLED